MERIKQIIVFIGIANLLFALGVSFWGLMTNSYFNDFRNYKSLKKPKTYMEIDTLMFRKGENYTNLNDNPPGKYIVYGILKGDKSKVKIVLGNKKYFNFNLEKHAIYKSKLTKDYFLKNAPVGYYKKQYRSFLTSMYLKLSLFPLLGLILYILIKHRYSI